MAAPLRLDNIALLRQLADGNWHSGEDLATVFDVTRAAISKRLGKLQAAGWPIVASRQHGYRAPDGLDLLDTHALQSALPGVAIVVHDAIDSTNAAVMAQPHVGPQVVLAEHQSAGRGRRGRNWSAPPGQHLTLTVDWRFQRLAAPATGLSPAIAVAVAQALNLPDVRIKWPNDLVVARGGALHKLGGVLIEASGEAAGPLRVIVGVGLNVADAPMPEVDQLLSSIRALGDVAPRTDIAIRVAREVIKALERFEQHGLQPAAEAFATLDVLAGQAITVEGLDVDSAIAKGLAPDGGLRIATQQREQVIYSGDVSVRLQ